jgi:hypothetical protein
MPRRRGWSSLREALLPTPMWAARRVGLELARRGDEFALKVAPDGQVLFADHGPLFGGRRFFTRRPPFSAAYDHPNEVMAHLWSAVVYKNAVVRRPQFRELVEQVRRWWLGEGAAPTADAVGE